MYRLAPLLMELARACSAAVAAMQGDAGPLVFGTAQYIRPDGQSANLPLQCLLLRLSLPWGCGLTSTLMWFMPVFVQMLC